jgi:hypothetical protein
VVIKFSVQLVLLNLCLSWLELNASTFFHFAFWDLIFSFLENKSILIVNRSV